MKTIFDKVEINSQGILFVHHSSYWGNDTLKKNLADAGTNNYGRVTKTFDKIRVVWNSDLTDEPVWECKDENELINRLKIKFNTQNISR